MLNNDQQKKSINQGRNLNDSKERARILMQYAGIFPHAIKQFGETVVKKHKPQKNYSR